MSKIDLDKYYTPKDLAKRLIEKTFEVIGKENITEIVEPSAGDGSFSKQIDNCIAYDIAPEDDSIIKQDFLELELEYKKGRLFIGNPPFGGINKNRKNNTSYYKKFINKSLKIGDFCAFILPATQYNISNRYKLIYSEYLGEICFSKNKLVNCCFNIYLREEIKNEIYLPNNIKVYEQYRVNHKIIPNSIRICGFGNSVGRLTDYPKYAKEFVISCDDKLILDKIETEFKLNPITNYYYFCGVKSLTKTKVILYVYNILRNDNE